MKPNGHACYYDKLTPEERFRLDVLASARGDAEESDLLLRTCQRETYTMNYRGFSKQEGRSPYVRTPTPDKGPSPFSRF